jgi:chromosome partitioning protein
MRQGTGRLLRPQKDDKRLGPQFNDNQGERMGRVVAVVNQKGGVGKTTTAVNLAASLAVAERRVLLVDLDPQANASSGLGVGAQSMEESIYAVLVEGMRSGRSRRGAKRKGVDAEHGLARLCRKTDLPTLHVVPSGPDLYAAEVELSADPHRFGRLKQALEAIESQYDIVLIDCPPSLGVLTLNALCAAQSVLIPMQCEYYALEGLTQLTRTLDMVRQSANPQLTIEGVLLTMYDRRNNLARQVSEDVRRSFGRQVYDVVIPRNVRLSEAPSFGKPILLYDVGSTGAQSYMELAREFLARLPASEAAA